MKTTKRNPLDHPPEYRPDGWPLCPQCGDDELMSTAPIEVGRQPAATDPLLCLRCQWRGTVPPRGAPFTDADAYTSR